MGKPFSQELDRIGQTLAWCDSLGLTHASEAFGRDGKTLLACIGSGGSSSAAQFAARLAQQARGQHAIALTPLEYVQRLDTLGAHDALVLSAEGKNSDVRMAAAVALDNAQHTCALTFRADSPLVELLAESARSHLVAAEAPWDKDGYLATNSLIAMQVLLARAVTGAGAGTLDIARTLAMFAAYRQKLVTHASVTAVAGCTRLLALHGAGAEIAAIDLESKFAESAFATVQCADLRQFAHGRHIQLAPGCPPIPVVALICEDELDLWVATRRHLPSTTPVLECVLPRGFSQSTLQGLLFVFALVEAVGRLLGADPGEPQVPLFARHIHALEAARFLPRGRRYGNPKIALLRRCGTTWSSIGAQCDAYLDRLAQASIRGLVLDFDGTCCETPLRLKGMDGEVAAELQRLLDAGMGVAFASGRGDSLYDDLKARLSSTNWPQVLLGCHSGSTHVRLSEDWHETAASAEFAALADEFAQRGVHEARGYKLRAKAGQFTIECQDASLTSEAFLAASELAGARPGWRAFRSSHSVDVLTEDTGKSLVVDWLSQELGADAQTQLLRIGDRGEVHGNDGELLGAGLSLSVDGVSADAHACWVFGDCSANASQRALAYLRALKPTADGRFRLDPATIQAWRAAAHEELARLRENRR